MTPDIARNVPEPLGVETASRPPRIVIVGAGIAGLAAALRVAREAPRIDLVVCEADARPGGVIATERGGARGEYLVERGPDSFLTEKPEALRLCEQLGIADRLVEIQSDAGRVYVVRGGRLVPLPDGFRLVAPTRVMPWLRSPLFSWSGKFRMAMDWVLPRPRPASEASGADESVASFVIRRFGREAYDRVAQPMIGTIYTADAASLSLAATMPRLREIENRYGSVIRGLARAQGTPSTSGTPTPGGRRRGLFAAPRDGMQTIVDAAVAHLPDGALRLGAPVFKVTRSPQTAGYSVALAHGGTVEAEAVVLAVNAPVSGRLLGGLDAGLASDLGAITYASSASVTLAYRRGEIPHPLDGGGFIVPALERRPILAASFSGVKFPGRAPAGRALIRTFLGGALAPEMVGLDDDRLVAIVRGEMRALLGVTAAPELVRIHRHRDAMPQYAVGHLERVDAIESRLARHPGLALAGAAYRGIGVPDCIRSGEAAAQRVLAGVATEREERSG